MWFRVVCWPDKWDSDPDSSWMEPSILFLKAQIFCVAGHKALTTPGYFLYVTHRYHLSNMPDAEVKGLFYFAYMQLEARGPFTKVTQLGNTGMYLYVARRW